MSAWASGILPLSSWKEMSTVRPSEGDQPAQPSGSPQPSAGLWSPLSACRKSSRTARVTSSAENASCLSRMESVWRTSTRRSLPAFSMNAVRAVAVKTIMTSTSTITDERRGEARKACGLRFTTGWAAPAASLGWRSGPPG